MPTAVVSDLHLGAVSGRDVLRRPEARDALVEALSGADQVVVLGDTLELREQPVARVLEDAAPALDALARACRGRRLVLIPGNHDHHLARPLVDRLRVEERPLGLEQLVGPDDHELLRRVAERLPGVELAVAYPGLWLREDVFAIHGHYVDMHLTVPRLESIMASAMERLVLGATPRSPDDYEAALGPVYAFLHELAQTPSSYRLRQGGGVSRSVWASATGRRGPLRRVLVGNVAIPAGVALVNTTGIGPYRSELSGAELRDSGLRAIGEVVANLGVEAEHVLFGHTHRPGPLPEDRQWRVDGGARLWNTGSWYREESLLGPDGRPGPYWPGTVIYLDGDGPPRLENALRDVTLTGF